MKKSKFQVMQRVSTVLAIGILLIQVMLPAGVAFAEGIDTKTSDTAQVQEETTASEVVANPLTTTVKQDVLTGTNTAIDATTTTVEQTKESETAPSEAQEENQVKEEEPAEEEEDPAQEKPVEETVEETPAKPAEEKQTDSETTNSTSEIKESSQETSTEATEESSTAAKSAAKVTAKALVQGNYVDGFEMILNPGANQQVISNGDTTEVDLDDMNSIQMKYSLSIPSDVDIEAGDTYTIDLPDIIQIGNRTTPVPIENDGVVLGSYVIQDNKIVFTFNEEAAQRDDVNFYADITGAFNKEIFETQDEVDVKIPYQDGTDFEATIVAEKQDYEGTDKKQAGKPYVMNGDEKEETSTNPEYVDWKITANDSMNDIANATVIDTLGDNQEIVPDSFKVYKLVRDRHNEVIDRVLVNDVTPIITAEGFELPLGAIKDAYEIEYTTKLIRPDGGGKLEVNNTARIILDDDQNDYTDKVDVTFSQDIPTIQKDGALSGEYADVINWTVKYNFGKADLGVVTLTDVLSKGEVDLDSVVVTEVDTTIDGEIVPGSAKVVTITPQKDAEGNLVIPDLDAAGKAYLITFQSQVPIGLNETITNVVEDSLENKDDAEVPVDTIPTGGKVGEQHVDEDGKPYIEWTITLNSKKVDVSSINIRDVFSKAHLDFNVTDDSLYELYRDGGEVDSDDYAVTDYEKDGKSGFALTIDPAGPHEYKFVYRTYYTELGMKEPELANDAELIFDNGEGEGITKPIDYTVKGPKAGIQKEGEYVVNEDGTEEILWTITFNRSKILLNSPVITDDFSSKNYQFKEIVSVTENGQAFTDYQLNQLTNGFELKINKQTNAIYEIKYRTTADDEKNAEQKNVATLTWQGGDESDDATVPARKPGIEKTGTVVINPDGTKTVNWTITFNKNKHVIDDFELVDTNLPATVTVSNIAIKSGTTDVTGQFAISEAANGQFTVSKDKLEAQQYVLTYSTTLSPTEEAQEVKNTANISFKGGTDKAEKTIPSPKLGVQKDAVRIDKTKNPKQIEWKITANTDDTNKLVQLVDAVLSDTIPSDQKLIKDSIKVTRVGDASFVLDDSAITADDNAFSIQLPNGAYQYVVTYATEIIAYPSVNEKLDRYTNATELVNNKKDSAKDDAYIDYFADGSNNDNQKTGNVNEETENIDWSLTVNPLGLPIAKAKITDQLSNNHTYVDGSIKVMDNAGKELIKGDYNLSVAEDKRSFTITFNYADGQIEQPIKITYSTRLNADLIGTFKVTNSVILTGGKDGKELSKKTSESTTSQWSYGGGGSGKTLNFVIDKNYQYNDEVAVKGVTFKATYVNIAGKTSELSTTIFTDKKGQFSLNGVKAGRYILEETDAPEGYATLEAPVYVIVGYANPAQVLAGHQYIVTVTDATWSPITSRVAKGDSNHLIIYNDVEKTTVEAEKIWENGPAVKPTVWFQLYRTVEGSDAEPVAVPGTLKELKDGTTKVSWEEMDKYSAEDEAYYVYSVKEVDAEGNPFTPANYVKEEDGLVVTNSYESPLISVTGTKVWENGSKPAIELQLFRDGEALGNPVTVDGSETTPWTYTWQNLAKTDSNGKEYTYTIDEVQTPEYYQKALSEDGLTVTNTFVSPLIDIPVQKIWEDADNQDGLRPDSVDIQLLANGEPVDQQTVTLSDDNQWQDVFEDLPEFDNQGQRITYTVQEQTVPTGYESQVTGDVADGFVVTNQHTPSQIAIPVQKVWDDANNQDGIRPEVITIRLFADGEEVDSRTLTAANDWQDQFTELDEYRAGELIEYTIEEEAVEGYTSEQTIEEETVVFINSHTPETLEIAGTKTWDDNDDQDGKRPETITVRLLANGDEVAFAEVSAADDWQYAFSDLPKFADGEVINYTIQEDGIEDYSSAVNGYDVTNTHTPGKTSVNVVKAWDDAANQDGLRPESVTVELLANGEATGETLELTSGNKWQGQFVELTEYKEGKLIEYSVKEVTVVDGYEPTITGDAKDGYVITNSRTPETLEIAGTKTWDDNDNEAGKRPDEITLRLFADGDEVAQATVTAADDWEYAFTDLPKFAKGHEIAYHIQEDEVENYSATIVGYDVINTYTPNETSVDFFKIWKDGFDQDGLRPDAITVKLFADGVDTGKELTVSAKENWQATFTGLDLKNEEGQSINYTLQEVAVEGYSPLIIGTSEVGYVIINIHKVNPNKPKDNQPNKPSDGKQNPTLPNTGEAATLWMTIIGLAVVVLAGWSYLTKARKKS